MTDLSSIAPRQLPDPSAARPARDVGTPPQGGADGGFGDLFDSLRAASRPASDAAAGHAASDAPDLPKDDPQARDSRRTDTKDRDSAHRPDGAGPPAPARTGPAPSAAARETDDGGQDPADDPVPDDLRQTSPAAAAEIPIAAPIAIAAPDTPPPAGSPAATEATDAVTQKQGGPSIPDGDGTASRPVTDADAPDSATRGTTPAPVAPQAATTGAAAQTAAASAPRGQAAAGIPQAAGAATAGSSPRHALTAEPARRGADAAGTPTPSAEPGAGPEDADGATVPAGPTPDARPGAPGSDATVRVRLAETATRAVAADTAMVPAADPGAAPVATAAPGPTGQAPILGMAQAAPVPVGPQGPAEAPGNALAAPFVIRTEVADWMDRLVERIGSGAATGLDEIEMTLSPRNLGTLTVRIDMRDTAASVAIVTETPEAARLFNDQQGKLAELLNQSGLSLGEHRAGPGDGSGPRGQGSAATTPSAMARPDGPPDPFETPQPAPRRAGLVDLVA